MFTNTHLTFSQQLAEQEWELHFLALQLRTYGFNFALVEIHQEAKRLSETTGQSYLEALNRINRNVLRTGRLEG